MPKDRSVSKNSRAARRAAQLEELQGLYSDLDLPPPKLPLDEPAPTLLRSGNHLDPLKPQNNGVKKKISKPLKRGQRIRQQKGLERAEIVMDQMELKVKKSKGRFNNIKERREDWDNINANPKWGSIFDALPNFSNDMREKSDKNGPERAEDGKENKSTQRDKTSPSENVKAEAPAKRDAVLGRGTFLQLPLRPPPCIMGPPSARMAVPAMEDEIG